MSINNRRSYHDLIDKTFSANKHARRYESAPISSWQGVLAQLVKVKWDNGKQDLYFDDEIRKLTPLELLAEIAD